MPNRKAREVDYGFQGVKPDIHTVQFQFSILSKYSRIDNQQLCQNIQISGGFMYPVFESP